MAVSITVSPEYDLVTISKNAGQPDENKCWYDCDNGLLFVEGVTQESLDAALANYTPQHASLHLAKVKIVAQAHIDIKAGEIRSKYITTIPGQAEVYQEKYDQAVDYITNNYPVDTSPYPMIQAEANATGYTPTQSADAIVAQRSTWLGNMSSIEEERRRGKVNIEAAVDETGVNAARDAALASLEAL